MIKKRLAFLANGWYNKGICEIIKGMRRYTEKKGIDIFLFLTYSQFRESREYNDGEFNIHRLPDYHDFDGVIFIPDSFSSVHEAQRICKEMKENDIPLVSIGCKMEGIGFISCNNYKSMSILCEHLAAEHDIKRVAFIAGHKENGESNDRLAGCRDTFAKYGVEIRKKDIYYCNWEYATVVKAAKKIASDKSGLPDMVVCANDVAAMAVCSTFQDMGIKVPEDVKVTGYDNIPLARAFSPSITTMEQPYEEMGYMSVEALYELAGKTGDGLRTGISKLIIGESCGCERDEQAVRIRSDLARENFVTAENNILFERSSIDIENAMFKTKSYEELPQILQEYFEHSHEYERDGFAIVMEKAYAKNIYSPDADLKTTGYAETMSVPVMIKKGHVGGISEFKTRELVPGYKKTSKTHIYIFSSLHSRNNIFGYVVMKDAIDHIEDRSLYTYMSRMGESFEKYRKIMRLDQVNEKLYELSVRDSLTGLFNRYGYETTVVGAFKKDNELGKKDVLIFIDINRLKYINDTFGHLQGDMAIRTVGSVISECIPKDWFVVRYGGDEFLIFGSLQGETDIDYLCERISSTVEKRGEELRLPYRLSASSGYLITEPGPGKTMEEYVEIADRRMYENKKRTYLDNLTI